MYIYKHMIYNCIILAYAHIYTCNNLHTHTYILTLSMSILILSHTDNTSPLIQSGISMCLVHRL